MSSEQDSGGTNASLRGGKGNSTNRGRNRSKKPNATTRTKDQNRTAMYSRALELVKIFEKSGQLAQSLGVKTREERKIIHEIASRRGLITQSYGKDPNRSIEISVSQKKLTRSSLVVTEPIVPSKQILDAVTSYVTKHPIKDDEMKLLLTEKEAKHQTKSYSAKNRSAVPPKASCNQDIRKAKERLPATKYKKQILSSIAANNVVIISGGTGCGKTTQVPQFILEDAHENKKHVRIMVTQPRRIAAISISERVARERKETLGETVGYQVRLESKYSDNTILTYCTTGVLLRMLTGNPIASGITHIIMDEIHEREINTDYLLIAIRECLHKRPDLKVILMSATIEGNMQLFAKYFENQKVDVIRIESRTFDVKVFYLDQILAMIGYEPPESNSFFPPMDFQCEEWVEELKTIEEEQMVKQAKEAAERVKHISNCFSTMNPNTYNNIGQTSQLRNSIPQDYSDHNGMHVYHKREWDSGPYHTSDGDTIDESTMNQFMRAVGNPDIRPIMIEFRPTSPNSVFVNGVRYTTHPDQTPGALLKQKEDRAAMPDHPLVFSCFQPSAIDPQTPSLRAPPVQLEALNTPNSATSGLSKFSTFEFGGFGEKMNHCERLEKKFREELKTVLPERTVYYHPCMDEQIEKVDFDKIRLSEKYNLFCGKDYKSSIDHNLLSSVIQYLADSPVFGSILVFLPGYDDIQEMMGRIDEWKTKLVNMSHVLVIPLHSQMHSMDHGEIFKPVNQGTRKIILATNIAEASITIEDVIFVVDTGKVKEKSYDHEAKLSTLAVTPIAKSNAQQRSGRAGRVTNGYCIRLYSENQFNQMPETQVAEMKRAAIYDVTLHAKIFAPKNTKVAEFLALAPEPPSSECIEQSMAFLEQIGAFYSSYDTERDPTDDPQLTDLGRLMSRLPLDPQLSRMLLFGLALKCFTPILNLVALLSNRDPYMLPTVEQREDQAKKKMEIAQSDFSDHLLYIRLCSTFCAMKISQQNQFCRDSYLNASTMKLVNGTRRQLLQELVRAKVISIDHSRDLMTILTDREFNKHSDSWPMVQAAISAGCYPSIGVSSCDSKLKRVQTFNEEKAILHPSSILKKQVLKMNKQSSAGPQLEFVAFQELCQMPLDKSLSIKTVTAIPGITALLFTGSIRLNERIIEEHGILIEEGKEEAFNGDQEEKKPSPFGGNFSFFNIDEWYSIKTHKESLRNFLRLRCKFMYYFLQGISDPCAFGRATRPSEKELLETIRMLLESEHSRYKFSPVVMPNFYLKDFARFENAQVKRARNDAMERENTQVRKTSNERHSQKTTSHPPVQTINNWTPINHSSSQLNQSNHPTNVSVHRSHQNTSNHHENSQHQRFSMSDTNTPPPFSYPPPNLPPHYGNPLNSSFQNQSSTPVFTQPPWNSFNGGCFPQGPCNQFPHPQSLMFSPGSAFLTMGGSAPRGRRGGPSNNGPPRGALNHGPREVNNMQRNFSSN